MYRIFFTMLSAAIGIFIIPDMSYALAGAITITFSFGAGVSGGVGDSLCEIVGWFDGSSGDGGNVGKAVASLSVIFLGIGAFFGKVTWGMALMFAAGIVAIFGANSIVHALTQQFDGGNWGCAGSPV